MSNNFVIISLFQDLDSSPCTIEYTINGETQGKAFEFEKESLEGKPLYPHISTKNIGYKVNFGQVLPTLYSSVPPKPKVCQIKEYHYKFMIVIVFCRIIDEKEILIDVQMTTRTNMTIPTKRNRKQRRKLKKKCGTTK